MSNMSSPKIWNHNDPNLPAKKMRDPRIKVGFHMGWSTYHASWTTWPTPEPDNFNRAILADKPIDCELTKNCLYWRDQTGKWWSLYIIAQDKMLHFEIWLKSQTIEVLWVHNSTPEIRTRRAMLHAYRHDSIDFTDNEWLYIKGYYKNFVSKYYSQRLEDFVAEQLGPPRQAVLEYDLSQFELQEECED
jgi:hypothetical protein